MRDPLCIWDPRWHVAPCVCCAALAKAREDERERVLSLRPQWERAVAGCLKSCIDAHGPITEFWTGSAAKRVVADLKTAIRSLSPSAAAPTHTPASGDDLRPVRIGSVEVCRHYWPIAYLCQKCEAEKKASNPADAGRE